MPSSRILRGHEYSLLSAKEALDNGDQFVAQSSRTSCDWLRCLRFCSIQIGILAVYTAILFTACNTLLPGMRLSSTVWKDDLLFTPMRDAFRYQVREVDYNFESINPFKGRPLEEIEEQWDKLLNQPHDVLIASSDLRKMNRTSISLNHGVTGTDGSDQYVVQPITYHMLHCLYALYKYAHPDFYSIVAKETPEWIVTHTDHCVDNLRQFVQCHASSGVSSFSWQDSRKLPWPTINSDEVCVDWDRYDGWVRQHSLSVKQMRTLKNDDGQPLLVHPKFGAVTPEDYGKHAYDSSKL